MSKRLLVATHNPGKVAEYASLLARDDIRLLSLDDLQITFEVAETGQTFMENAQQKAAGYARATGLLTLADDSGIEVDALGGEPGIYTARYGGSGLKVRQRYELLLANLEHVPPGERGARFCCAIALAGSEGQILATASGRVEGEIALQPAGARGHGYDPVFYLPDKGRTMAQLAPSEKNAISHRGRAVRAIEPALSAILADE